MIRVVVVDDNALLRAGLITVLNSAEDIEVVGEADGGRRALTIVEATRPDLVLMDVEMPDGDGISATERILQRSPQARVLILTMFDLDEYVITALRAGASGFLLKTTDPQTLIDSVRENAAGRTTLGPTVVARLIDSFVSRPAKPVVQVPGLADLTGREVDVLRSMARGQSNAEIAGELYLAETTVKTHVARILAKLGVRDRLQAVVLAHRSGLAAG